MTQLFPCRTASGREIWYLQPERTQVHTDDLYFAARRIRRYVGALDVTLLDHLHLCVSLANLHGCSPEIVGYVAIHDLHESYVLDLPSQMKQVLPEYKERIEIPWERHVHRSLGFDWPVPPDVAEVVKVLDFRALHVEIAKVGVNEGWTEHLRAALSGEYGPSIEPPTGRELGLFTSIRHVSDVARWNSIFAAIGDGARAAERRRKASS